MSNLFTPSLLNAQDVGFEIVQQQPRHQLHHQQQPQIEMAQQIVLLPNGQNINVLGAPKMNIEQNHQFLPQSLAHFSQQSSQLLQQQQQQQHVQMIVSNEPSMSAAYLPATASAPNGNVSVILPGNLILNGGLLLLPQNGNEPTHHHHQNIVAAASQPMITNQNEGAIELLGFHQTSPLHQQQQFQTQQPASPGEYIAITTDPATGAIEEVPATHLITNNGQILGILNGLDQLIIQGVSSGANHQQPQLLLIETENEMGTALNLVSVDGESSNDINSFLAANAVTSTEVNDQIQAQEWLKDSYLVNRALRALKTSNTTVTSSTGGAIASVSTVGANQVVTEQPQHLRRYHKHHQQPSRRR